MKIVPNNQCENKLKSSDEYKKEREYLRNNPNIRFSITSRNLCAEGILSGASTCKGDSGGALVCQDSQSGAWTVQGVISWTSRV